MDWILVIAIAYSMVGVSLAGFVSANFIIKHLLYLIWIVTFMQYM